jgi:phospholipid/cholesterol/gamma-HCH transport system permease protein
MTALDVRDESEAKPATLWGRLDDQLVRFGEATDFFWAVSRGVLGGRVRRYFVEVLRQATIFATGSVVIVLALVFAFGLVIGIEASYGARLVGAPSAAGLATAIGDLREITPYAFGYMMAAKVSTGYVAEIGTMRITDEIDALDVMGLDSQLYLCSTRLLAVWLILPFLYSGIKGMVMATFVVLVGCYYGFKVRGGPVEVGTATAKAMIVNLMGVQLIGILGSQLFWGGAPHLAIGG